MLNVRIGLFLVGLSSSPTRGQGHGSDSTPWRKCYCPMVCEETGTVRIILSIATYCPAYILQPSAKHIGKLKQILIDTKKNK